MRLLASLLVACAVAFALFLLMVYMVSNQDPGLNESADLSAVNFIRFDRDQSRTRTKERQKPPEEKPPEEPPPPTAEVAKNTPDPQAPTPKLDVPNIQTSVDFEGAPYLGSSVGNTGSPGAPDSEIIPVVQVPPQYPPTAKRANIEGYVTLEFTVLPDGSVTDIKVIDSQPPRMFDQAAKDALARWKFKPRTQGGKRVSRNARQTIRFSLDNS